MSGDGPYAFRMSEKPAKPTSLPVFVIPALLSAGIIGIAAWRAYENGTAPAATLAMPAQGEPDLRFRETDPWQNAGTPRAVRLDFPAGTDNGTLLKIADNQAAQTPAKPGVELTGIGARNTALGDPVFSVADGVVIETGETSAEQGNVIVIAHIGPDGAALRSVYSRLDKIEVTKGSQVARGAKIGTMGTADGHHPAGLHFGWRDGNGNDLPGDPLEPIRKSRNPTPPAAPAASKM